MLKYSKLIVFLQFLYAVNLIKCDNYSFINLPQTHLSYYFNNYPKIRDDCLASADCIHRKFLESDDYKKDLCWGYEDDCKNDKRFSKHRCPGDVLAHVKSKNEQLDAFYTQADFGEWVDVFGI